jgi:hypothetical protein
MEKRQIDIGSAVITSGLTVIPVTETRIYGWQTGGAPSFFSLKRPLYVLVKRPGFPLTAFSLEGEEIHPEWIAEKYPHLLHHRSLAEDY